jgi:hypothetical protein
MNEYYSGLCGKLYTIFWNRLLINLKFMDSCVSNEEGLGILFMGVEVSLVFLCITA